MVLKIVKAVYGDMEDETKQADVTERLNSIITNPKDGGKLRVAASSKILLGNKDPAPGKVSPLFPFSFPTQPQVKSLNSPPHNK